MDLVTEVDSFLRSTTLVATAPGSPLWTTQLLPLGAPGLEKGGGVEPTSQRAMGIHGQEKQMFGLSNMEFVAKKTMVMLYTCSFAISI